MKLGITWACAMTLSMVVGHIPTAGNIQMDLVYGATNALITNRIIDDNPSELLQVIPKIVVMDSWVIITILIIGQTVLLDFSSNIMWPRIGVNAWKQAQVMIKRH